MAAREVHGIHALILVDGEVPDRTLLDAAWPGWADAIELVLAADGGARHAAALGFELDRVVGDMDSVPPSLLADLMAVGVAIERALPDKDETDAELALLSAVSAGARAVTILGALGGPRVDHALANVALLGHPALDGLDVRLYDEHAARISTLVAPDPSGRVVAARFDGRVGDLVSLIPLGSTATGVTTEGLRFPLRSESLGVGRTRGSSNVRMASVARITLESGRLLVVETPATVGR